MSIFKETFPKFVRDQLLERETILSSGIDPKTGKHDGSRSNDFLTYTLNKQCILRLSSGVDIEDSSLLESGEKIGNGMASQWVLQGGIQWNDIDKKSGGLSTPNNTGGYEGAYGSTQMRGDSKEGYGIVPMPGIIDAQIRTKSAYGSLREGKVKFVCHNKRQLEILETLYMRPGYTLLLEWQWTPYFKDGEVSHDDHFLTGFFGASYTHFNMNNDILKAKKESQGNYDALIGYCKNFSYTLRPDGGFDCETEIIAKGEIIESLKTQKPTKDYSIFDSPIEQLLIDLNEIHVVEDAFVSPPGYTADSVLLGTKKSSEALGVPPSLEELLGVKFLWQAILPKGGSNGGPGSIYPQTYVRWDALASALEAHIPTDENNAPLFYIQTCQLIREDEDNPYIEQIKYSTPKYLNESPYNIEKIKNLYTGYTRDIKWEIDVSTNPNICILPHKAGGFKATSTAEFAVVTMHNYKMMQKLASHTPEDVKVTKETVSGASPNYSIGAVLFATSYLKSKFREMYYDDNGGPRKDFSLFKFIEGIWNDVNSITYDHDFIINTDNRPLGKVVRIIDKKATAEELDLDSVYELKIQSLDSVVRDINYSTTIPSALSSTIAIAAQAPDSIDDLDKVSFAAMSKGVRDRFAIKSKSEPDEKRFNKRFEEALQMLDEACGVIIAEEALGEIKWYFALPFSEWMFEHKAIDDPTTNYNLYMFNLSLYMVTKFDKAFNAGGYGVDANEDSTSGENITRLNESVRKAHKAISILSRCYGSTNKTKGYYRGQAYSGFSPERSSVIPLKFNCKMDGISGIVIGNVFKLPKDKLPTGYGGDDIHFIVMGEEQSITSGQDWTTSISGHLILLGGKENMSEDFKESWKNKDLSFIPKIHPDDDPLDSTKKKALSQLQRGEGNMLYQTSLDKAYGFDEEFKGDNTFRNPLQSMHVTSMYGPRDLDGDGIFKKHEGIDLRASVGTPVIAVADGTIDSAKNLINNDCGGFVSLRIEEGKYTEGVYKFAKRVTYCHLSNWSHVNEGAVVKQGDIIGHSGGDLGVPGAGSSKHAHLHFTVVDKAGAKINPTPFLNNVGGGS